MVTGLVLRSNRAGAHPGGWCSPCEQPNGLRAAACTDIAIEAAHVALMHEDWSLVPELFRIARRTMQTVKTNIGFTAL